MSSMRKSRRARFRNQDLKTNLGPESELREADEFVRACSEDGWGRIPENMSGMPPLRKRPRGPLGGRWRDGMWKVPEKRCGFKIIAVGGKLVR